MNKRTARRKRRQRKAAMRNRAAKPTHRLKTGRTGSVDYKRTRDRQDRSRIVASEPTTVPESVRLREVRR